MSDQYPRAPKLPKPMSDEAKKVLFGQTAASVKAAAGGGGGGGGGTDTAARLLVTTRIPSNTPFQGKLSFCPRKSVPSKLKTFSRT